MSEPHQLPEATRANALAKIKAREDAIKANAIGQGRKLERADATQEMARMSAAHTAAINATETAFEKAVEKTGSLQRAIGYHKAAWQFGIAGAIVGAALACFAVFTMQGVIWDTAARSFREQAMTGAMLSSQGEREPEPAFTERP